MRRTRVLHAQTQGYDIKNDWLVFPPHTQTSVERPNDEVLETY